MENEKTIDALNKFIEIHKDRIEGYEKASEITEERDLKGLFTAFEQTSNKCIDELESEIIKFGGQTTIGKLHRDHSSESGWILKPP